MARKIAAELSRVDPGNAALYRKNAAALSRRLDSLTGEIRTELDPLAGAPYVVFHDAYRYFESRFGLSPAGAIAVAPGRRPGAKRLTLIRRKIRSLRVACILAEPQFTPRLVKTVMEGTGARLGVLDPLGADLEPGGDMYFSLMRRMASSLRTCLAPEAGR
jgi:zinc transport system substrate-binding protein